MQMWLQWRWLGGLVLRRIALGLGSWVVRGLVLTTVPQTAEVRTDRTEPPRFGWCLGKPRTAQPPHGSVSWQTEP